MQKQTYKHIEQDKQMSEGRKIRATVECTYSKKEQYNEITR